MIYLDGEPSIVVSTDANGTHFVARDFPTLDHLDTRVVLDAVADPVGMLSRDGRLFAQAGRLADGSQQLVVVDLQALRPEVLVQQLDANEPTITALAFSGDNQMLIVGDDSARIGSIDLSSGDRDPVVFADASGAIWAMGLNSEGTALFALIRNGSAQWWDVATRQKIGDAFNDAGTPYLVLDGDLHHLAVNTDLGVVQWNVDFDTWPGIACERAGRNLTRDEWARYLPTREPYHTTCPQFPAPTE